ncbi:MAG: hypothetical protein KatS3mg068_2081 [Candidatus Sericytochromatia bacterium]|nr:MAG: hypothetical protein KatS3mg068_2081 [Candidatus Sericytochromatia bacterium]
MTEKKDYSYLLDVLDFAISESSKSDNIVNLKLEGDFFSYNNVSKVNRNLFQVFSRDSNYNLSLSVKDRINKFDQIYDNLKNFINKPLESTDITITHYSKYSFMLPEKHWIVYINWDYGSLPNEWIEPLSDYVDQIWVSSNYMKDCFKDSRIDEEKIKVVNTGVDTLLFNPNITTNIKIPSDKKVKLLYKGNTDWNSGLDILLKAYFNEFTYDDDICLVLCIDKINIDRKIDQIIRSFSSNSDDPEIYILDSNIIPIEENVYKSCDFFVSTYRTESYCLEILESMASGIPVITNSIGACRDYCNEDNSIIVKSDIIFESKKEIKGIKTVSFPFWIEPQINDLRVKLRKAYNLNSNEYQKLSKNASKEILSKYTWIKINSTIKDLIYKLKEQPIKKRCST